MVKKILPAEWHKQCAVMLTWPHAYGWSDILEEIDKTFLSICEALVPHVTIIITATDVAHKNHLLQLFCAKGLSLEKIHIYVAKSQDVWVRDHGPITIYENGKPILLKFIFNGWGNKYPAEADNQIVLTLSEQDAFKKTPVQKIDFILEGGGIESNGEGTLLLTKEWIFARHPNASMPELEKALAEFFGISHFLWLEHGFLVGDDTDSHIDTLARFVNPDTIAYVACDDPTDEHYEAFQKMEQHLKSFRQNNGLPYRLVALPWPKACISGFQNKRLPAGYANFLISNEVVLVPIFNDDADEKALAILQDIFPRHKMISIDCRYLVEYYGGIHCATMQLPEGVL